MAAVEFSELHRLMVEVIAAHAKFSGQLTGRPVLQPAVMRAMADVPRHEFVPSEVQPYAYADGPLPIGCDKTISQPFIVALMVDLLDLDENDSVLEIGTGLGYQAAVLSRLASRVYTVDIIEELAGEAVARLGRRDTYDNVEVRVGNGYYGWPEQAPFDKIVVAAASEQVPPPLIEQLKPGGRMVMPLGMPDSQQLNLIEKDEHGDIRIEPILPVRFAQLVMAH